jgi:hypothetical protein
MENSQPRVGLITPTPNSQVAFTIQLQNSACALLSTSNMSVRKGLSSRTTESVQKAQSRAQSPFMDAQAVRGHPKL